MFCAPAFEQSASVSSMPSSCTSHSAKMAPRFARSVAIARPIPYAAPVTTMASPLRSPDMSSPVRHLGHEPAIAGNALAQAKPHLDLPAARGHRLNHRHADLVL